MYLHRYGQRGLLAALFLLTIPLCSNIGTLIILFFHSVAPRLLPNTNIAVLVIGLAGIVYLTDKLLKKTYLRKEQVIRVPRFKLAYYILGPVYYIASAILFFLSFKYF